MSHFCTFNVVAILILDIPTYGVLLYAIWYYSLLQYMAILPSSPETQALVYSHSTTTQQ